MSLSKAIASGKEHRTEYGTKDQPYCKFIDKDCRNHGICQWCRGNRMYRNKKELEKIKEREKEWMKQK